MSNQPELEIQVQAVTQSANQILKAFAQIDMSPLHQLDLRLKGDKNLLDEFIADPASVVQRETGIVAPNGTHFHFINNQNEYFPPEGGALQQLLSQSEGTAWSRVEVRSAVGPGCIAFCGVCLSRA